MTETSPDGIDYLGIALYDANEQDLVDTAIANATVDMPEWTPREGNTEVVLLEGMALIGSEVVFSLNRLTDTVIEGMLRLYGLTRDPGAGAEGTATFTLADTLGHTIPAGTTVRVTVEATGELVDMTTVEPLEILAGESAGTVGIRAVDAGIAGNGVASGTLVELIDAVSYVDAVTLASDLGGGREIESDVNLFNRGASVFARLVSTLVLPDHFTAAALARPEVFRATTLDLYDPTDTGNAPGDNPGHVTVAVLGAAGAPLTTDQKSDLEGALTGQAIAGVTVHVVDVVITSVDVTGSIVVTSADTAAVQAAVQAALTGYLSANSYPWTGSVYVNELISLIDQVPGVGRVVTITVPAADFDLNVSGHDYAALPETGTITITVVDP